MRFGEQELVQGLVVLAANEAGDEVHVSVYGGRDNACGVVRYELPDPDERAGVLLVLRSWAATEEPVALLTRGDTISIIAERQILERALETS